jgi:hypothetical protein
LGKNSMEGQKSCQNSQKDFYGIFMTIEHIFSYKIKKGIPTR